jgi:hypothetical protein
MKVTGSTGKFNGTRIPEESQVGVQIKKMIGTDYDNIDSSAYVTIDDWSLSIPSPPDTIKLKYENYKDDDCELRFEKIPRNYRERADSSLFVSEVTLDFKRIVDHSTSTEYIFDDSGNLIPESQYDESEETSPENVTYKVQGNVIEGDSHRTDIEDTVMNRSQVGASKTPEQRFCTACGENIEDSEAKFCPYCGTEL